MMYRILLIVGLLLMGTLPAGAQDTQTRTIFVGPTLADCMGVTSQKCLQVKDSQEENYQLSFIPIEGFTFEPGYIYQLQIEVTPVENPPADAPTEAWSLVDVMSTTRALEGNLWQLASYQNAERESVEALAEPPVTLEFSEDGFGGSAGCNSYGGSYAYNGATLQLTDAVSTLMACADDEVMTQESQFLAILSSTASYQIVDDQLQLMDAEGVVLMTFDVVEPAPLVGTTWVMTSYNNGNQGLVSALADVDVTAMFGEDGQLAGSAGCNGYGRPTPPAWGCSASGQPSQPGWLARSPTV